MWIALRWRFEISEGSITTWKSKVICTIEEAFLLSEVNLMRCDYGIHHT
jgi:hypothetical protein